MSGETDLTSRALATCRALGFDEATRRALTKEVLCRYCRCHGAVEPGDLWNVAISCAWELRERGTLGAGAVRVHARYALTAVLRREDLSHGRPRSHARRCGKCGHPIEFSHSRPHGNRRFCDRCSTRALRKAAQREDERRARYGVHRRCRGCGGAVAGHANRRYCAACGDRRARQRVYNRAYYQRVKAAA